MELSHSGPSEVHLTGYRVEQMVGGSDDDEGAYGHYREGPFSFTEGCRAGV